VLSAMRKHSANADVAHQGCGALWNLAKDNADNKVALNNAGAVDAVHAAMRIHRANSSVSNWGDKALEELRIRGDNQGKAGSWAIRNLGASAYNRAALLAADALRAIVNYMRNLTAHVGVARNGCGALENLAAGSTDLLAAQLAAALLQDPCPAQEEQTEMFNSCGICLETFDDDTHARTAFTCGHCVCQDCAYKQDKCPICRQEVSSRTKLYL